MRRTNNRPILREVTQPIRRGLSLVEVTISTLLVGLVCVAALKSVGGVIRTRIAAVQVHDGTGLAQEMMTEVLSMHYEEPDVTPSFGREDGESPSYRTSWDDVDDYNGWSASKPQDRAGSGISGYTGWTRAVTVTLAQLNNPLLNSVSDVGLKRIEVTVTDPSGRQTMLTGWRSQWGVLEQPPAADATVQTHVRSELQVGSGTMQYSGVHFKNHAKD